MFCDRCSLTGEGAPRRGGLDRVAVESRDGAAHGAGRRFAVDLNAREIGELDRATEAQLHRSASIFGFAAG